MFNFKQIPSYFGNFFKPFRKHFTKPQFNNFKRFICGLIISDKKNIQEINATYGDKDQSSLNRFVTQSDWDLDKINKIRLNFTIKKFGSKPTGLIIIDDTVTIKTGKKMEKANYHRSGVTKKKEWGHCFVDTIYAELYSDIIYPINLQSYLRKVDADENNSFKTKREIALEQIDFALSNRIKAYTVIADAWYYSEDFVKELKYRALKHLLGIKVSTKISIDREKRITIEEYLATLTKKDFSEHNVNGKTYFLHSKEVSIRRDGKEVLLVSYKKDDEDNIRCYVTDHFGWDNFMYMKALLKRWDIESFHRDSKQHLGLEEYQVRKYRGMQVVALAVLLAYTLLILNQIPSLLKGFRPLQTIGEMCRFAQLCAQKSRYWLRNKFCVFDEGKRILNQMVLVKNAKV